jgi:hypothetical protein
LMRADRLRNVSPSLATAGESNRKL